MLPSVLIYLVSTGSQSFSVTLSSPRSQTIRQFLELSPLLAAHPKSASATPLVATLTKNGHSKSFACRTYKINQGGAPPLSVSPETELRPRSDCRSAALSYSNPSSDYLRPRNRACYHTVPSYEVLFLPLAAPFSSRSGSLDSSRHSSTSHSPFGKCLRKSRQLKGFLKCQS